MDCDKARGLFNGRIDGLLTEAEREALETHSASCVRCARELGGLVEASRAARSAVRFRAPEGFSSRVMAGIRAAEEPGFFKWLFDMPVHLKIAQAAAFAVAVAMGIYSAGLISDRLVNGTEVAENADASLVASVSIEYLDPVPPESMGDMYLASEENGNEN